MLEAQEGDWHLGRRLRQLEGVSGRGLLTRGSAACGTAAHYVTISLRCPASGTQGDAGAWQLVYRSEAVGGTLNPDWLPPPWGPGEAAQPDPLLHSSQAEVLLALHAVLGDADDQGEEGAPALLPALSGESLASEEQLAAAYEPPASLAAALEGLQRPVLYAPGSRPAVCLAAGGTDAPAAASGPAKQEQQDNGRLAPHQQQVTEVQNGHCPAPPHPTAEERRQEAPQQQQLALPEGSQSSVGEAAPSQCQQQHSPPGERGGNASPTSPATAPAAAAAQGPAEALAATGCCPGRVVAAWQAANLGALWPAGADLAAVRQPLQPNTLVLRFGDGLVLCPPPLPPRRATRPASHQTSPFKHAASQAAAAVAVEGGEGGAGGPGATRRLANLLVSRLLRSAPNLQEAEAALDGGAMSDAESDAGSDVTAATTASQLTAVEPGHGVGLAGGRHAAAPHAGGGRVLTVAGAYQYITSLAALRGRLRDLAGRVAALQQQLDARLEPARQHAAQQQQLAAVRGEAARCAAAAAAARARLGEVAAEADAARKLATTRAQALVTTLKVMQAAERRLGEAEASLQGEGVRGAAAAVLRELVARRCQMVAQLGAIFQLGPTQVSVPEAPPGGYLEDRLEQQWAGAGAAASAPSATSAGLGGATPPWGPARQEMRLSIAGLELRSAVWRAAFEEGVGAVEPEDDRDAAVALGYLAQVVDRLAAYLDVPLRYPLLLRGSRSAVVDSHPPVGTWSGEGGAPAARRPLLGQQAGEAGSGGGAGQAPASYPLYCEAERDRPRFAVAVFLLNKDVIQLLQAHGISAGGPTHLLQNVYKLVLAAQSGLPRVHLPPPGGLRA